MGGCVLKKECQFEQRICRILAGLMVRPWKGADRDFMLVAFSVVFDHDLHEYVVIRRTGCHTNE